jgi:hypothetical protein
MIRRPFIRATVGACLLIGSAFVAPGCSNDPAQPGRESISLPRKGGGVEAPAPAVKGKTPGGKLRDKGVE